MVRLCRYWFRRLFTFVLGTKATRNLPPAKSPRAKIGAMELEDRVYPGSFAEVFVAAALGGSASEPLVAMAGAVGEEAFAGPVGEDSVEPVSLNSTNSPSTDGDSAALSSLLSEPPSQPGSTPSELAVAADPPTPVDPFDDLIPSASGIVPYGSVPVDSPTANGSGGIDDAGNVPSTSPAASDNGSGQAWPIAPESEGYPNLAAASFSSSGLTDPLEPAPPDEGSPDAGSPPAMMMSAPVPFVTVGNSFDAAEGGPAGGFTLDRSADGLAEPLSVWVGLSGTATAGDYTVDGAVWDADRELYRVDFEAGEDTADIGVTAIDDGVSDPAESVAMTIDVGDGSYTVGGPATGMLTIRDNEPVPLRLFTTGVDDSGAALADGATDPHYTLSAAGGLAGSARVVTADGYPIGPWVGNDPLSRWIAPALTDTDGNAAPGDYVFETTVDLTGLNPATARITGTWASDNTARILLNGAETGIALTAEQSFRGLTPFRLASGFVAGVNTISFVVTNAGTSPNPTGLRVASLTGTALPAAYDAMPLFGTGIDDARALLPDATPPAVTGRSSTGAGLAHLASDPNFVVHSAPAAYTGGTGTKVLTSAGGFPVGPWVADNAASGWIVPSGTDADGNAPPGEYVFRTTVTVTDPAGLVLTGRWTADNRAVIRVNGQATGVELPGAQSFRTLTPFALAGPWFTTGTNTIDFVVTNDAVSPGSPTLNPVGVRVEWDAETPSLDPHFVVSSAPSGYVGRAKVIPNDGFPIPPWLADGPDSRWIAPLAADANGTVPPGEYVFRTTVDLNGYDPATAVVTGRWATDNAGVDLRLNGVSLGITHTGPTPGSGVEGFRDFSDFTITNGMVPGAAFVDGLNTLEFVVRNDGSSPNPGALRVDELTLGAIPSGTTVSVEAIGTADEAGPTPGYFRFTRTGNVSGPLTVSISVGGTASGGDFTSLTWGADEVDFGPGVRTVDLPITPVDDSLVEGTETVEIELLGGPDYSIAAVPRATLQILDDDLDVPADPGPWPPADFYNALRNRTLVVPSHLGVLANDSNPVGQVAVVSNPRAGTLELAPSGAFTYTPEEGYSGYDWFYYRDGTGEPVFVEIAIRPAADWATPDTFATSVGASVVGSVVNNDDTVTDRKLIPILVASAGHGTVVLNPDGTFEYTPAAGFQGQDTFQYRLTDGLVSSDPVAVAIRVGNRPPRTGSDRYVAGQNSVLSVSPERGVLANDLDPDGTDLTAAVEIQPVHGTVVLAPDGSFVYTPNPGYVGTDTFGYRATDGLLSTSQTVAIAVDNTSPVALPDLYSIQRDTPRSVSASGGVLANDDDPDGDSLLVSLTASPQHGSLLLNADGSFSYTPAPGFVGMDQFRYQSSDGVAATETFVSFLVEANPPRAVADLYLSRPPEVVFFPSTSVLVNDTAAAGSSLSAELVAGPTHGNLVLAADGTFTYTPTAGFPEEDSFTYRIWDGGVSGTTAVVTLRFPNGPPTGQTDTYQLPHGRPFSVTADNGVLANDSDSEPSEELSAELVDGPAHGSLALAPDGSFVYTPIAGFSGTDGFTYRPVAGSRVGEAVSVTLTVTFVRPRANPDQYILPFDGVGTVSAAAGVLANDSSSTSDPLVATLIENTTHGVLELHEDGSFTYEPDPGFVGTDRFQYRVSDGVETSRLVSVDLVVTDRVVLSQADQYDVVRNSTHEVDALGGVLTNDWQVDSLPLTAELVTGPQHGTVTLNADGSFAFTPETGYLGTDVFRYRAFDGTTWGDPVEVQILVLNNAPVGRSDRFEMQRGTTLTVSPGVLANDVDDPGEVLVATLEEGPSTGSFTFQPDGTFEFTPLASFEGTIRFTYSVSDGLSASEPVVVTIDVVNTPPDAGDDDYETRPGQVLTVEAEQGLLANDLDDPGQTLTPEIVSGPQFGTLTLDPTGSFVYTPFADFVGIDLFTYRVADGFTTGNTAIVRIEVNGTPPTAAIESYRTRPGTALVVTADDGVLANDSDPDRDPLIAELVDGPAHGTLNLAADGSFLYTPVAGYAGADSFRYRASDGSQMSEVLTVEIDVNNTAPVASDDQYFTGQGAPLTVAVDEGLLANDGDFDDDALSVQLTTGPLHGSLALAPDGSFVYTPGAGFTGLDFFEYTASDSASVSPVGRVEISVSNTLPDPLEDAYVVAHGRPLYINASAGVLANDQDFDGDPLTAQLAVGPSHGTLTLRPDGGFVYTPEAGYTGEDAFSYRASDGAETSAPVLVSIAVANDRPLSAPDFYRISHGQILTVSKSTGLLANDTDPDRDPLTAVVVRSASHGTVALAADGSFLYTPAAGFAGTDSFTYAATDGILTGNEVLVTVSVTNSAPLITVPDFRVGHDGTLSVSAAQGILSGSEDLDGDPLNVTLVSGPSHGTLGLSPDGGFVYTPAPNYFGIDSFEVDATDGAAVLRLTVPIRVVNTAPVAVADTYTLSTGSLVVPSSTGVLANDVNWDGDTLVPNLVSGPSHGTLSLAGDGSFVYTPVAGYIGNDAFSYRISDGVYTSGNTTVTIRVTGGPLDALPRRFTTGPNTVASVAAANGLLSGVSNPNQSPVSPVVLSGPSHGTLVVRADGSFDYTPGSGYTGPDAFTYAVTDGIAQGQSAVVDLVVTNVAVVADAYRTPHDVNLSVAAPGLLGNDFVAAGITPLIRIVTGPEHGTVDLTSGGGFIYAPTPGYVGSDSFTYAVSDGVTESAPVVVSLEVWNRVASGTPNLYHVPHDESFSVAADRGVLANDIDDPWESLFATLVAVPSHGVVALGSDGSFVYTPATGYVGTDSFTYTLTDGITAVGPVLVTLDVWNLPPGVNPDRYRVHQGQRLTVSTTDGVLANDFDDDGDTLTASLVGSGPAHGSLVLQSNGAFVYEPDAGFTGTDGFSYEVRDGATVVGPVLVSLAVENRVPVVTSDRFHVLHDTTLTGTVATNDRDLDGDTLAFSVVQGPSHGSVVLAPDGTFVYVPTAAFAGIDSFTYRASDGAGMAETSVEIDVRNTAPRARSSHVSGPRGASITGNALTGAGDRDGDALTAEVVSGPSHGTLSLAPNGMFSYLSVADFAGTDSFTFRVSDGVTSSEPFTVTVTVEGRAPVALDDTFVFRHGSALTGNVLADDWDPDGDPFVASLVSAPTQGTLNLAADGTFTFTAPRDHWTGVVTFKYQLSDGAAKSQAATVTLDVRDSAPVGLGDAYRMKKGQSLSGSNVLANDFDADGDALTVQLVGSAPAGLTLNSDGTFTYTPTPDFSGTTTFQYQAFDGAVTSSGEPIKSPVTVVEILVENIAPVGRMDFLQIPRWKLNADPVNPALVAGRRVITESELLGNDSDADGDALHVVNVSQPQYGFITANEDGTWTYTVGVSGQVLEFDTFTYEVSDGRDKSQPVTVLLTQTNPSTVASPDSYRVRANSPLTVSGPGILGNDWSSQAGSMLAKLVTAPANGSVALDPSGSFVYTPASGYVGTDTFTYSAAPGSEATVTVQVYSLAAASDSFSTIHGRGLRGNVLANDTNSDGEVFRAELVSSPSTGTLLFRPDGSFLYTPAVEQSGSVSFSYRVTNGYEQSNPATVTIDVTNGAPVATADAYSTSAGTPLIVNGRGVVANDTDPDGDRLTAEIVSGPAASAGTVTLATDGSFLFVPAASFAGTTQFTYRLSDGILSTTATATINVSNVAPTVLPQSYTLDHGQTLVVGVGSGVLHGATDEQRFGLSAEVVGGPQHGQLTMAPDGSFTYTPDESYVGEDAFTFQARDAVGAVSAVRSVSLTVTNVLSASPWASTDRDSYTGTTFLGSGDPVVSVRASGTPLEGAGGGSWTFSRTGSTASPLEVFFAVAGSASAGDYTLTSQNSIVIPAGKAFATVGMTPVNDTEFESDETVVVEIQSATGYQLVSSPAFPSKAELVIGDNDAPPPPPNWVWVSASSSTSEWDDEGYAQGSFTLTRVGDLSKSLTVDYTLGGMAELGSDYTMSAGSSATQVTFGAGQATATVYLSPIRDYTFEPTEAVTLQIAGSEKYQLWTPATRSLWIYDTDKATVWVTASGTPSEAGSGGTFTFHRGFSQAGRDDDLVVNYTVSGTASDSDYTLSSPGSVTIPAGKDSVELTLTPGDDSAYEGNESVVVSINPGERYGLYQYGYPYGAGATLGIADNDPPPSPSPYVWVASTQVGTEGVDSDGGYDLPAFITLQRSGSASQKLKVDFTLSGDAQYGVDYTLAAGVNPSWVEFPAGQKYVTIQLNVTDDQSREPREGATLTLLDGAGYLLWTRPSGTAWIDDNDRPQVRVTSSGPASEAGGTGTITFTRVEATGMDEGLELKVLASGAVGDVTVTPGPGGITIPAGAMSVSVTVAALQDSLVEGTEGFTLELVPTEEYAAAGVYYGGPYPFAGATVSITDDDFYPTPPTGSVWVEYASGGRESGSPATFGLRRSGDISLGATVSFTLGGTATAGTDYTVPQLTAYFAPYSATAQVVVTPLQDERFEPAETVTLTLTGGGGLTPGSVGRDTLELADDDRPYVSITPANWQLTEGAGTVTLTVTRSTDGGYGDDPDYGTPVGLGLDDALPVSLVWTGPGADDLGAPWEVVIPAGKSSVDVTVSPPADGLWEGTESARVEVAPGRFYDRWWGPGGYYYVTKYTSSGLILDADAITVPAPPDRVWIDRVDRGAEVDPYDEPSPTFVTFRREGDLSKGLTAYARVAGGTAGWGSDFQLQAPTLTWPYLTTVTPGTDPFPVVFAAGAATASLWVSPVDDQAWEPTETIDFAIVDGKPGYLPFAPSTSTVRIDDNDTPVLTLSSAGSPVEGGAKGTFTVSRPAGIGAGDDLVVPFRFGGTASPSDYTSSHSGTVTIPAGQTSAVVTVTAVDDTEIDPFETVEFVLLPSDRTAAAAWYTSRTISISDNDVSGTPPARVWVSSQTPGQEGDYDGDPFPAYLSLRREGNLSQALTVFVRVTGGTAEWGGDFALTTPMATYPYQSTVPVGTDPIAVQFAAGSATATVILTPVDDPAAEPTETVTLEIVGGQSTYQPYVATTGSLRIADNDPPVSPADFFLPIVGDVLEHAFDVDGDPLSVSLVSSSLTSGTLSFQSDGSFVFTPDPGAIPGQANPGGSFRFAVSDGWESKEYTVTLSYATATTPSTDTVLSTGETYIGPNDIQVRNLGPGTVRVVATTATGVTLQGESGTEFQIEATGDVEWTGDAAGSLVLDVDGTVGTIAIGGDLTVTATGDVGDLSGRTVTVSADNVGQVSATLDASVTATGEWDGSTRWSPNSAVGVLAGVTAGRDILSVTAASVGDLLAGRDIVMVQGYDVVGSVEAGRDVLVVSAVQDIVGAISAGGNVGYYDAAYAAAYVANPDRIDGPHRGVSAGRDLTGGVTASGTIWSLTAGRDASGAGVEAGGDIAWMAAGRTLSADVSATGTIASLFVREDLSGEVSGASLSTVRTGVDLTGEVRATIGSITTVTVGRDLTGSITAETELDSVTVGRVIDGNITANSGTIGAISAWEIGGSASITAGDSIGSVSTVRELGGSIETRGGGISSLASGVGFDVVATVVAAGAIGSITAGRSVSGDITLTSGSLMTVAAGESVTGTIQVADRLEAVSAGQSISGSITAGSIGTLDAGADVSGSIDTTSGDLTSVYAGGTVSGDIHANGSVVHGISAGQDVTGDVSAGGDIAYVRAGYRRDYRLAGSSGLIPVFDLTGGNLTGSVTAGGSIGEVAAGRFAGLGGSITSSDIRAESGSVASVRGDAEVTATISATSVGSVVAGGTPRGGILDPWWTPFVNSTTTYLDPRDYSAGSIGGEIESRVGSIGSVVGVFGSITADVSAATSVGVVTAGFDVLGAVHAGTSIGDLTARTGVTAEAGNASGSVSAGTFVGGVHAGKDVGSVSAEGAIGEVVAGLAGGGNITESVVAGGQIGRVVAIGHLGESAARNVYARGTVQSSLIWNPGESKPSAPTPPRPELITIPSDPAFGNIRGSVSGASIGTVTAFGDVGGDITSRGNLGSIWTLGEISGDLSAGSGGISADVWGDLLGSVQAPDSVTLRVFGDVDGDVTSRSGAVSLTSYGSVNGSVSAALDADVWVYATAAGDVTSTRGGVRLGAMQDVLGVIQSAKNAIISATNVLPAKVQSFVGDVFTFATGITSMQYLPQLGKLWVISLLDVNLAGKLSPGVFSAGDVAILSWGNVRAETLFTRTTQIWAVGDVTVGSVYAQRNIEIEGRSLSGGFVGAYTDAYKPQVVQVSVTKDLNATINASDKVELQVFGDLKGTVDVKSSEGYIAAAVAGNMSGTLQGGGGVGLKVWGDLSGTIDVGGGAELTVGGNVTGSVTTGGYTNLVAWNDVSGDLTSKENYVALLARGDITGSVTAGKDADLEVWGDLKGSVTVGTVPASGTYQPIANVTVHGSASGDVTSSHNIRIETFGDLTGNLTAKAGSVEANAYKTASGSTLHAATDATLTSWGTIQGVTVSADNGSASVWAQDRIRDVAVTGKASADVTGMKDVQTQVTATAGSASVVALGSILTGTTVKATEGSASATAGKDAELRLSADGTGKAAYEASLQAGGKASGSVTASDLVTIAAQNEVDLFARSTAGAINASAGESMKGTYDGKTGVTAMALGSGGMNGTFRSADGAVQLITLGEFEGKVEAGASASITAKNDIKGSTDAWGAVDLLAGGSVQATISALDQVTVSALGGTVEGDVTSFLGSISVTAQGDVSGSITGLDVDVLSRGEVTGDVTAAGSASVVAFGSVSGATEAGDDASVFAKGNVEGFVNAGRDAEVTATGDLKESVTAGRDASVQLQGDQDGTVRAERSATVTTLGEAKQSVTAVAGSATVTARGRVGAPVQAGLDASVWTADDLVSNVTAGRDASVEVWGDLSGTVQASRDLGAFAYGKVSSPLLAGRDLSLTAIGDVSGPIAAGGSASVTTLGNLSGPVTAGETADVFAVKDVTGSVTATSGDAIVSAVGAVRGNIDAGRDVVVSALDEVRVFVHAGRDAAVSGDGDETRAEVTAGRDATVWATKSLTTATITAGRNVDVVGLGEASITLTAGGDVTVLTNGRLHGEASAGGSLTAVGGGLNDATLTAVGDATVGAFGEFQGSITAGGEASLLSVAAINGGDVSGDAGVLLWSQAPILSADVRSKTGDVTVLGNSTVSGLTVSAGRDATVAGLGSGVSGTTVTAGRDAILAGRGLGGSSADAGRDVRVVGIDTVQFDFSAGRDADLIAAGGMTANGTAGRDLRAVTYGTLEGSLTAGDDLAAWALGNLDAELSAGDSVYSAVTYGDFTGSIVAGTGSLAADLVTDPLDGFGSVRGVYAWGRLDGSVSSSTLVGEAFAGTGFGPDWSVTAPAIGRVEEHDRSPFVEDPAPPVLELGALAAQARDAARQLDDLKHDLDDAAAEAEAGAAATAAEAVRRVADVLDELARLDAVGRDRLDDAETEVSQAVEDAERAVGQALSDAADALDAATRTAIDLAGDAKAELTRVLDATQGDGEARRRNAEDHHDWLLSEAGRIGAGMDQQRQAAVETAGIQDEIHQNVFASTFLNGLGTFVLDYVQDKIDLAATILNFIPLGVTQIAAAALNGVNAAIFAVRGKYEEAASSVFAMLPIHKILGPIAKGGLAVVKGGAQLGGALFRNAGGTVVTKFIGRQALKLGTVAKTVICPIKNLAGFPGCFAAGTPVECEFGSKAIETIVPGDKVWSRDEWDLNGKIELKVVEEVFVRETLMWELELVGGVVVRTSAEHPFWVAGKGWVGVDVMRQGDKLVARDGTAVELLYVRDTGVVETVYNFRVADWHTYFVGCAEWGFGVWVHNRCSIQARLAKLVAQGIPGATHLLNAYKGALAAGKKGANVGNKIGSWFHARRAFVYARRGTLQSIEQPIGNGRIDLIVIENGRRVLIDTKSWTKWHTLGKDVKAKRLTRLTEQVNEYISSSTDILRLEFRNSVPKEVRTLLVSLKRTHGDRLTWRTIYLG